MVILKLQISNFKLLLITNYSLVLWETLIVVIKQESHTAFTFVPFASIWTTSKKHTHPFNGPLSGTTQVSRYQKCKTNLDFTEARDSEWQWHQLGRMQVCTLLQTDNHASTPPLSFLQAGCPSCRPTNSVKALKAQRHQRNLHLKLQLKVRIVGQRHVSVSVTAAILRSWRLCFIPSIAHFKVLPGAACVCGTLTISGDAQQTTDARKLAATITT